jgi:hypothetical protein
MKPLDDYDTLWEVASNNWAVTLATVLCEIFQILKSALQPNCSSLSPKDKPLLLKAKQRERHLRATAYL